MEKIVSKKLENLIAGHAYWSDKIKALKAQGCEEMSKCTTIHDKDKASWMVSTCIDQVYEHMQTENHEPSEYGGGECSFEDAWNEAVKEGEVCGHCINVRTLKAERIKSAQRLGSIRGAMTRIGRKLEYNNKKLAVRLHHQEEAEQGEL